jgi:citrate lyase subunit beta/citryl-CoA lyase
MTPRSWLIVPGDSEEKISAALSSQADAVILDLEDSVAPGRKPQARELLGKSLGQKAVGGPQRWVRINSIDSEHYGADLSCCENLEIEGLMLPRAEDGNQVARLAADTQEMDWKIHALVTETARSMFHLASFEGCSGQLTALSWGIDDLAVALGASSKFDANGELSFTYKMARSLCLAAARAAGVQPVDGVFRDVTDHARLQAETEAARREGFTGKLAIDTSQIAVINAAFTPTHDEITAAQAIVDAFEAEPETGTFNLRGRLIDRPRLMQARAVLERARGE